MMTFFFNQMSDLEYHPQYGPQKGSADSGLV